MSTKTITGYPIRFPKLNRTIIDFLLSLPYGARVTAHATTDSMLPVIRNRQEITIQRVRASKIKSGSIIAYFRPDKKGILVHRVISRSVDHDRITFRTKGDNLDTHDEYVTRDTQVIGVIILRH